MTTAAAPRALTAVDAEALRTRSRADFVYESLRDAISDGRIAVGERVREEEIARNLGVSRTPVREALQRAREGTAGSSCHDAFGDVCGVIEGPKDLSTNPKHLAGFGE